VLFDATGVLADWGMASANQGRKRRLLDRFNRLLARHEPTVLVMEAQRSERRRGDRIRRLYGAFNRAAVDLGMEIWGHDRVAVATALKIPSAASRYDVAQRVAERLPELSHRLPRKQSFGASEDARQSLFAAAALGLAHLTERSVALPPVHPGAPE
jgi:hypothetical protein